MKHKNAIKASIIAMSVSAALLLSACGSSGTTESDTASSNFIDPVISQQLPDDVAAEGDDTSQASSVAASVTGIGQPQVADISAETSEAELRTGEVLYLDGASDLFGMSGTPDAEAGASTAESSDPGIVEIVGGETADIEGNSLPLPLAARAVAPGTATVTVKSDSGNRTIQVTVLDDYRIIDIESFIQSNVGNVKPEDLPLTLNADIQVGQTAVIRMLGVPEALGDQMKVALSGGNSDVAELSAPETWTADLGASREALPEELGSMDFTVNREVYKVKGLAAGTSEYLVDIAGENVVKIVLTVS